MIETLLTKKLGIKPQQKLLILNAPEGYLQKLDPLPEGAELQTEGEGEFDFVQLFAYSKTEVDAQGLQAWQALKAGGSLWYSYPKKTGKIKTDLHRDYGWEALTEAGLETVTLIAIDDTWSSLRFRPRSEIKSYTRGTKK